MDELYLVKSASASPFSQWEKDRALNLKKTWWVRAQYQGLCQPTAIWNESEHSSSDSLLEPCPPWATMRRLLEERTWCGNYVTKRSAQNSDCLSNCCLFCAKWPDSPENNKELWMGKHKGFHRALYWLALDELKWLWFWQSSQEHIEDSFRQL